MRTASLDYVLPVPGPESLTMTFRLDAPRMSPCVPWEREVRARNLLGAPSAGFDCEGALKPVHRMCTACTIRMPMVPLLTMLFLDMNLVRLTVDTISSQTGHVDATRDQRPFPSAAALAAQLRHDA